MPPFGRSTSDFRRAAPAGLPSVGAVYLWKLLRLNCLMPHEWLDRERGFDDDDDRITRLSNAENELQRKNCAPSSSRSRPGAATPSTGLRGSWRSIEA